MTGRAGKPARKRETAADRGARRAAGEQEKRLRAEAEDSEKRITLLTGRLQQLRAEAEGIEALQRKTRDALIELGARRRLVAELLGEEPPLSVLAPIDDLPEDPPDSDAQREADGGG